MRLTVRRCASVFFSVIVYVDVYVSPQVSAFGLRFLALETLLLTVIVPGSCMF